MSGKSRGWPWSLLDLKGPPGTTAEVRRAYASKLKTIDQSADIAGFEALRAAYEAALQRTTRKAAGAARKPAAPEPQAEAVPPDSIIAAIPDAPAPGDPLLAQSGIRARLHKLLDDLQRKNILVSDTDRILNILGDPEFQSPDLQPDLRYGLGNYLRGQLNWNHLNEPYLRHPGVTDKMLHALDARFGWLSDYNAFRRDFHGDTHLLEAMLDAAGIDRTPRHAAFQPARDSIFKKFSGYIAIGVILGFISLLRVVLEAGQKAGADSEIRLISDILIGILVLSLIGLGGFFLYGMIAASVSRGAAVAACVWMAIGALCIGLGNGVVPGLPLIEWPFLQWAGLSLIGGIGFAGWWLWHKFVGLVRQNRRRGK